MTLARIAELRRAETVMLREEVNITRAEWLELVDAEEAWELYAEARHRDGLGFAWDYTLDNLQFRKLGYLDSYPTPQAAVLAALKGKR